MQVLLTLTLTQSPATDLGFLLHKNPGRVHTRSMSFGPAHVFYPEASDGRCTAALLLDIDPVGLVRGRRPGPSLEPYVNDRPYVASSFLSSAIAEHFGTAMNGRSKERQELADAALPFEVGIPVLPARGGEPMLRRLFEPLGYEVLTSEGRPLHASFRDWGDSPYQTVRLAATIRLRDLLGHLYVLIPVLDDQKHYWVDQAEIDKLLHRGEGWLAGHPERDLITRRYLARQQNLTREALRRLAEEAIEDPDAEEELRDAEETAVEEKVSLHQQRIGAVVAALRSVGGSRVLDLGCGEGRLLSELVKDHAFTEIVGVDVSARSLEIAARRVRIERMNERQRERLRLIQGSLTYRDDRLAGYDAAVLMEVIEHIESNRLPALERAVFEYAQPRHIVVTTPNREYNVRFETLPAGRFRHRDHRFEWSRQEFARWATSVGERFGYGIRYLPIGPDDPEVGPPTQMAVFSR
jgi:3' terminal RNA ribose 2'-O-methyltransferase Hen1